MTAKRTCPFDCEAAIASGFAETALNIAARMNKAIMKPGPMDLLVEDMEPHEKVCPCKRILKRFSFFITQDP